MATANELLAAVSDVDKTLVIDSDLRTIVIPSSVKNLGVESDDDVLKLNFKMPGTYCGIDLSTFSIRINYLNANAEGDVYDARDAKLQSDGTIAFSWLVGRHATMYKGSVKFNVCLKEADADGVVQREFNTTIATLNVLEGLETDEQVIAQYTDIFEQWRSALFGLVDSEEARLLNTSQEQQAAITAEGDKQIAKVVDKGVETLATIPEDYTYTYNAAEEALRTKADAIVLNAKGESIVLQNASNGFVQNLKLYGRTDQVSTTGKQLLNIDEVKTLNNVFNIPVSIPAGTYIVTLTNETHSGDQSPYLRFYDNGVWIMLKNGLAQSVVLEQDETDVYLYTYGMSAAESDGVTATFTQLMVSATGGEWEPYTGGIASPSPDQPQDLNSINNPTVDIYGANLFDMSRITPTDSIAVNDDGTLTVSLYSNTTGKTLRKLAPGLRVGERYTLFLDTDGSNYIYLLTPKATWNSGTTKVMTEDMLDSAFYVYGLMDNTPIQLRRISIVPETLKSIEYESFKPAKSVNVPYELRGVPVESGGNYTDSNGQQWVCDEVDFDRGVYIQRCFDEVRPFKYDELNNRWNTVITYRADAKYAINNGIPLWCDKLPFNPAASSGVNGIRIAATSPTFAIAYYNGEALGDMRLIYPLETPIETELTAAEIQAYKALRTNYPNTVVINDSKMYMDLDYAVDTRTYIDELIAATSQVKVTTVTLAADKWAETASTQYQIVAMNGVTPNSTIDILLSPIQYLEFMADDISLTVSNDNGVVTIVSMGSKPTYDITIQVKITEAIRV